MNPVEQYRIIRPLGNQQRRKFNDVYLTEHKTTGQQAILKALAKTPANSALQERLRQEATFHFTHPDLPRTLDFLETDTEILLFLSFHSGIPLQEFTKTLKQREKPAFILRLLNQLLPLFNELKAQRVLHLDIKPSNIIFHGTKESFSVALIDFGLAMRTHEPQTRATLFPLSYAAPELLLNRLALADQRTDQFALGIVLWQLFTGKLPLLHPNPGITTNLQLTHPLPEDSAIRDRYFRVLARMTNKHTFRVPPNQLPQQEMDALLREGMNGRYDHLEQLIADWEAAVNKGWFR